MAQKIQPIDLVVILEQSGVLDTFWKLVQELVLRLPPGARPTPEQLDKIFGEAMAYYPGVVRAAIARIQVDLVQMVLTGKSSITRDDSSLA